MTWKPKTSSFSEQVMIHETSLKKKISLLSFYIFPCSILLVYILEYTIYIVSHGFTSYNTVNLIKFEVILNIQLMPQHQVMAVKLD